MGIHIFRLYPEKSHVGHIERAFQELGDRTGRYGIEDNPF